MAQHLRQALGRLALMASHPSLSVLFLLLTFNVNAQSIEVNKETYRSIYNLKLLCPAQVTWVLHRSDLGTVSREPSWPFVSDIPSPLAVGHHADYTHSGYDRGHLCPAADRSASVQLMRSTFSMSNICPQLPSLNRGAWKRTEIQCRQLATTYDSVSVVVIPVFLHQDTTYIGIHRLAVPHAFFKAVFSTKDSTVLGSWFLFNR